MVEVGAVAYDYEEAIGRFLDGVGECFDEVAETFFGVDASDIADDGAVCGDAVFGVDGGGGFGGFEAREVDAVAESLDWCIYAVFGQEVVHGKLGRDGAVVGALEETDEVSTDNGVGGLFNELEVFELAGDIVWVGVASGDDGDAVATGVFEYG